MALSQAEIDEILAVSSPALPDVDIVVIGTGGADVLAGTVGTAQVVYLYVRIIGDAGADILTGEDGNDIIDPGRGDDTVWGGTGTDCVAYLDAGSEGVTVDLGLTAFFQDTGGSGQDWIRDVENVLGSPYDDVITGAGGVNVLDGYQGDDRLEGEGGNDRLIGGAGDDTLDGGSGTDILEGGAGAGDAASYESAPSAVLVSLLIQGSGQNTFGAGTDTLSGIEDLIGSGHDDILVGSDGDNALSGGNGNDTLSGGIGDDVLHGGVGDDSLLGGDGVDLARYALAPGPVNASLTAGTATDPGGGTDSFSSIENLSGSAWNDTLTGDDGANVLSGAGGNDLLRGGLGDDTLDGGSGADRASFFQVAGDVTVYLNLSVDIAFGTASGVDTLISIEHVSGSDVGDDEIVGDAKSNRLEGWGGSDLLQGGIGNDTLDGGAGRDRASYLSAAGAVTVDLAAGTSSGADGADTLISIADVTGSQGYGDTLIGGTGANRLDGRGGNDVLRGGLGNDTLDGWEGTDRADYLDANGSVTVDLSLGKATGADGTDTLISIEKAAGSSGYGDTLIGSTAADTLSGRGGNDVLRGGRGNDTLNGGTGSDVASYAGASGAVTVILSAGTASGADGTDTLSLIENVRGGDHNDGLIGDAGANLLEGGRGNDILRGGLGDDTLNGGAGSEDRVSYILAAGPVTVNLALSLATGADGTDALSGIEQVYGSAHGDMMIGDAGDNLLQGAGGADALYGSFGRDTLEGGSGNDDLTGTLDGDVLDGGSGTGDRAVYGGETAVTIDLVAGTATGATGSDTLIGIEEVFGSQLDDTITGDGAANVLDGSLGADTIYGGAGVDTIQGGEGDDVIVGGAGADIIDGGFDLGIDIDRVSYFDAPDFVVVDLSLGVSEGADGSDTISGVEDITGSGYGDGLIGDLHDNHIDGLDGDDRIAGLGGMDTLNGGEGADLFIYTALEDSPVGSGRDGVYGFVSGTDDIHLSTLDADAIVAGDQAFVFIDADLFSGAAGELRYNANGVLQGDVDGDALPDFQILLYDIPTLVAGDLVL